MSKIDQALETLALALKDLEPTPPVIDYKEVVKSLPLRSLSGDHINGGIIRNFASSGITDTANSEKLAVTNDGVTVTDLSVANITSDVTIQKSVTVNGLLKVARLEVNEIQADLRLERSTPLEFKGTKDSPIYGKGLIWTGGSYTKQLILKADPDRLFSTESIEVAQGRGFYINGTKLIDEKSLSPSIETSKLKEVGRLRSLTVDGDININNSVFFSSGSNRLGLGTSSPNAALSIADSGVELLIGSTPEAKGKIGTFTHSSLELVTDNVARITVGSNGDVLLGNTNRAPIQVTVQGTLAVGVNTPDPSADLHVNGAIKFSNNLHTSGNAAPSYGNFTVGDIVWNTAPTPGGWIGWVCISAGSPGQWTPFGAVAR